MTLRYIGSGNLKVFLMYWMSESKKRDKLSNIFSFSIDYLGGW